MQVHPHKTPLLRQAGAGIFILSLVLNLVAGCQPAYPPPPHTPLLEFRETLHGVEFDDPYRWLEDQDSPQTRAWIENQNAYAETIIGDSPLRQSVAGRLRQLMDRGDAGSPSTCEDWQYFSLRRKGEDLPAIYRRKKPADPAPIDRSAEYPLILGPPPPRDGITMRVALTSLSRDCKWLVYSIREGGEDEVELRIRDLNEGLDLPEKFPRGLYSSVSFTPDSQKLLYSIRSRVEGARIREHTLGTPVSADREIFGSGYGPTSFVSVAQAAEGRYRIFTVSHGWSRTEVHFQDQKTSKGVQAIVEDADARFYPRFRDGKLYMRTNLDADNNRLLAVDLQSAVPSDRDLWEEVIPEAPDVMDDFRFIDEKLYVTYLHNASSRIKVFGPGGVLAGEIPIPENHSAGIRRLEKGSALLTLNSLTRPARTLRIDLETGERSAWDDPEIDYDPDDILVSQVWYRSKDGTRVPMFLVQKDLGPSPDTPVLLTGYGGFNSANRPRFNASALLWIERGGLYAVANLRGGSEFGERWHRAGMLENKQNVFDDFISAAEWLIDEGYTSPSKLAIRGGSNGGLLVASAFTQRPELFRAVLCGFPDLDMVRFYTFTADNNLPALLEYGNGALPEQFEFLRKYSPYQRVERGVPYPAVMLTSGDRDTRVPPLQARKMAARLQASTSSGLPVILRYHREAGHAAGRGRRFNDRIEDTAAEMTFLLQQLGVEPALAAQEP